MSISDKVKATPEFVSDFAKVTKHYGCPESEVEEMKQLARENMAAAVESFGLMARVIKS